MAGAGSVMGCEQQPSSVLAQMVAQPEGPTVVYGIPCQQDRDTLDGQEQGARALVAFQIAAAKQADREVGSSSQQLELAR